MGEVGRVMAPVWLKMEKNVNLFLFVMLEIVELELLQKREKEERIFL